MATILNIPAKNDAKNNASNASVNILTGTVHNIITHGDDTLLASVEPKHRNAIVSRISLMNVSTNEKLEELFKSEHTAKAKYVEKFNEVYNRLVVETNKIKQNCVSLTFSIFCNEDVSAGILYKSSLTDSECLLYFPHIMDAISLFSDEIKLLGYSLTVAMRSDYDRDDRTYYNRRFEITVK